MAHYESCKIYMYVLAVNIIIIYIVLNTVYVRNIEYRICTMSCVLLSMSMDIHLQEIFKFCSV